MGSKDQRTEGRVNVNWRTHVTRSNRSTLQAYVKNISWGGAQMESPILINKGEVLLMEISAPYKNTIHKLRVIAEVVYSILRPNDVHAMGIKFRKREPDTDNFFRQFLGPSMLAPSYSTASYSEPVDDATALPSSIEKKMATEEKMVTEEKVTTEEKTLTEEDEKPSAETGSAPAE